MKKGRKKEVKSTMIRVWYKDQTSICHIPCIILALEHRSPLGWQDDMCEIQVDICMPPALILIYSIFPLRGNKKYKKKRRYQSTYEEYNKEALVDSKRAMQVQTSNY